MDVDAATVLGVSAAVAIAAMGFLLALYSRMGKVGSDVTHLQQDVQNLRDEFREEIRTSTQRIIDALVTHEHDSDGRTIFRVPPTPTPSPADD